MESNILKPPRLDKGRTIGIIAPAGPVTPSEIQPGIDLLESLDYRVALAAHLYDRDTYLAGDDNARLKDLHAMFRNPEIRAILCARGGYGSLRILERMDFDLIRQHPKIIAGYSDITALLLAIQKKSGLVTFHGPLVREFSKETSKNLEALLSLISSNGLLDLDLAGTSVLIPGEVSGPLLGGNLSLLSHMVGTPFMPGLEGAILFFEERGEPLYRIDRMLTHLKMSGSLDTVAGIIAGGFEDCGDISSINELLLDRVHDLRVPLISGLPAGHGHQNITLPLGLPVTLNTGSMRLSSKESCVTV